jgi:UDP-N-acetylglucosamine--N-acetylmuramyl-(pentapeptide) pyrophosphoryl-undecaprenol N-acetylglucosamine transferase
MEKSEKINVVLTGGHAATTAIAVVEEIIRRKLDWKVYWLGAESAVEGKNLPTLESEVFPSLGVTQHVLKAGRLQRKFSRWTIPSLFKLPVGFFQAFWLLIRIKPKIVLSFGAYSAFPVVVCAFMLGIPVVVHEQTIAAGRANRASGPFARKIALARNQSQQFFPKKKCIVVGNPILTSIASIPAKKTLSEPPRVLISCGSRGSQIINKVLGESLERLLPNYRLAQVTGELDYPVFLKLKKSLAPNLSKNYRVISRINPMDMAREYLRADMVIARAGANTVSEIMAVKRPAILIPIPWSYLNEQTKNAQEVEKLGLAEIISQEALTPARLIETLNKIRSNWSAMVGAAARTKSPDTQAAKKLIRLLEETLG